MHQNEYTRATMRAAARPESNPDDPREWAWVEAAGKTLVLPDPYHKYWWVKSWQNRRLKILVSVVRFRPWAPIFLIFKRLSYGWHEGL